MANRRCVFLAVDGQKDVETAKNLVAGVMGGPMGQFIAGTKFNDALHMKGGGPTLVDSIYEEWPELEFTVFPDLKAADVASTVVNTVKHYYRDDKKLLVTVSVHSDAGVFLKLQREFPPFNTGERSSAGLQIAAMGVPTDMSVYDCKEMYSMCPRDAMEHWLGTKDRQFKRLAEKEYSESKDMHLAQYAISSFDMLSMVKEKFPWIKPVTPGIRDEWMLGNRGGQKRIVGIVDALRAGAFYVVLGNQLFKGDPAFAVSAEESQHRTAEVLEKYFAEAA